MPRGIQVDYFNELDKWFHFIDAEDKDLLKASLHSFGI